MIPLQFPSEYQLRPVHFHDLTISCNRFAGNCATPQEYCSISSPFEHPSRVGFQTSMDQQPNGENWINTSARLFTALPTPVDLPAPASATQMASRNIRSAKSQRRRATPLQSTGASQSMSFGAREGSADGGMFGANISAGVKAFDFSAKGGPQAPLFPRTIGHIEAPASVKKDERAEAIAAELFRRNHQFGWGPSNTPSNLLGGQQGSSESSTNEQTQSPNPFAIKSTSQPAAPGLTGSTDPKPAASSIFTFTAPPTQPASPAPPSQPASPAPPSQPASPAPAADFPSRLPREEPAKETSMEFVSKKPEEEPAKPTDLFSRLSRADGSPLNLAPFVPDPPKPARSSSIFDNLPKVATSPFHFSVPAAAQPQPAHDPLTQAQPAQSSSISNFGSLAAQQPPASQPASNPFPYGHTFTIAPELELSAVNMQFEPPPLVYSADGQQQPASQFTNDSFSSGQVTANMPSEESPMEVLVEDEQQQPANNPFFSSQIFTSAHNFGPFTDLLEQPPMVNSYTSSQIPSSSAINFGRMRATSDSNMSENSDSAFSQAMSYMSENSDSARSQPVSNMFTTNGMKYNSATSQPTQNMFGTVSAAFGNNYGSSTPSSQPTQNMFGSVSAAFGNNYGSLTPSSQPTQNIFGSVSSGSANNYGVPMPGSQPTQNMFGSVTSGSGNNYSSSMPSSQPTQNVFGANYGSQQTTAQPTSNLFAAASSNQHKIDAAQQSTPSSNPFAHLGTPAPTLLTSQTTPNMFRSSASEATFAAVSEQNTPQPVRPDSSLFNRSITAKNGETSSMVSADPIYERKGSKTSPRSLLKQQARLYSLP